MEPETIPTDILLRLALAGGFLARHLPLVRKVILGPDVDPASGAERPPPTDEASHMATARSALSSPSLAGRAEAVRQACARAGAEVVSIESGEYPALLKSVEDAPLVLYRRGSLSPGPRALAVVGSRMPTAAGLEFARILAFGLGRAGWTVVSGLARGIDGAAHDGALRGGGLTAAVLGSGIDVIYPPEHRALADRIAERGALFSELPPGTSPLPFHFPRRNRLISGMARGVVVAEARLRSGALITARCALDQGREVMAVPGSPLHPHTAGSNGLLRDGAAPVTGPGDVFAGLGWREWPPGAVPTPVVNGEPSEGPADAPAPGAGHDGRRILDFLGTEERHRDEIARELRIPVPELMVRLLDLELRKLLERRPGDYYKKMSQIPG